MGRWLQFDPIGYADSMSLYEYVSGNPIIYTDAYGLFERLHDKPAWTIGLNKPWSYFSNATVQKREEYRRQKELMDKLYAEAESYIDRNKDFLIELGECCGLGVEFTIGFGQGMAQGGLNALNSIQDAVIGVPNTFVGIYNFGIWSQKQGNRLNAYLIPEYYAYNPTEWNNLYCPYIPSPDWSKDTIMHESQFAHNASKFTFETASTFVFGVWIGKVTAASKAAQGADCASNCSSVAGAVDDVANAVDDVVKINGRYPINYKYAGKTHPSGVNFTKQGFPDFSPYSKAQIQINNLSGIQYIDESLANQAVGLAETPSGFVWHHVEDGITMQLIPKSIHNAARHTGGAAVIRSLNP